MIRLFANFLAVAAGVVIVLSLIALSSEYGFGWQFWASLTIALVLLAVALS